MNLKILTALALLAATPAFAASICIVCPPGYDCSTGKPAMSGTTGQVLTRTATGAEWKASAAELTIGTTSTTAAAGDHTHAYDSAQLYGIGSACAPGENPGGSWNYQDINVLKTCLCWKYKLDGTGLVSNPKARNTFSTFPDCQMNCSLLCTYSIDGDSNSTNNGFPSWWI